MANSCFLLDGMADRKFRFSANYVPRVALRSEIFRNGFQVSGLELSRIERPEESTMSISQEEFNVFVRNFNRDYVLLLKRAAHERSSPGLMRWFDSLRDSYEVILKMHDTQDLNYEVALYPFSLTGNSELFTQWGFSPPEIDRIQAFLDQFRISLGSSIDFLTDSEPVGTNGGRGE
jgi:hypothetical protein